MTTDPWTVDDPQPGDFGAVLATVDPKCAEHRAGDATATLRSLVRVEGEEALRRERMAEDRDKSPHGDVAGLLRDADRPTA